MKVIRKSDNEIIEVKEWRGSSDVIYSTPDMNEFYQASDLDFNLPEEKAEVIEGWVARDKDGRLMLHQVCPQRVLFVDGFPPEEGSIDLSKNLFPEITWESEPMRCKITITPME